MKLMGHVRALLMENPELNIAMLYTRIAPHFPDASPVWLRHRIGVYRGEILKQTGGRKTCLRCKGTGIEPWPCNAPGSPDQPLMKKD